MQQSRNFFWPVGATVSASSCVATGYQDCDYKGHNFLFMTLFIVQSDDLSFVSSWSVAQNWSVFEFKYMKK